VPVSGQLWILAAVILVAVPLVLAVCGLGSVLELKRDQRKARARKREAGEQP
jgi:hypothetical protein